MAKGGSTVVEHWPHCPKVEGSSPAISGGICIEKMTENHNLHWHFARH